MAEEHQATAPGFATWISEDLSELIPERYAAYRPLVLAALLYFFRRLPEKRQLEILSAGLALGPEAPVAERFTLVVRSCPTLHKLGQIVARDERLSLDLRLRLQELEVLPPSMSASALHEILEREIGALPDSIELAAEPLAEASVAVVLPFQWRPSVGRTSETEQDILVDGVFKILKPGIEDRLEEELVIWSDLGGFLEQESPRLGLPTPDYADAVERIRELLSMEVQLDREQANLRRARKALGGVAGVTTPEVLPFCSPRVTAMTRIQGGKITDPAYRPVGSRLADRLVSSMLARPLLSPRGSSIFHADPHAGNLLATTDGDLGILDWALVGEISKEQRVQIAQILIGAITLDPSRIRRAVARLATTPPDTPAVERAVRDGLRRLRAGTLPGLAWLFALLDDLAFESGVRFPGELILFRKALLTLRGVIGEVRPDFSIDLVMVRETLVQGARDWPRRWLRRPFDRDLGTHLSNAELLRLLTAGPGTLRRFLSQTLSERRPRRSPSNQS